MENRKLASEEDFEPQEVIDAIIKSRGSVVGASQILKVTRPTVYNYCARYPEVQKALDDVRGEYKSTCRELAKDNHLHHLHELNREATTYELNKMEPKADSINIDPNKLTLEELSLLRQLLEKGKPDGSSATD